MKDDELQLLLNSEDITHTVADVNATNSNQSSLVFFERNTESSIISSFRNGISVTISLSFGLLSFVASLPQEFQGITTGLLGNFNGDIEDDYMYPNGTTLDPDASDRMIHDFGQSCKFMSSLRSIIDIYISLYVAGKVCSVLIKEVSLFQG